MKKLYVTIVNGPHGTNLSNKFLTCALIAYRSGFGGNLNTILKVVLFLTLIICRTNCFSQQETWSSFQDIRQVTDLATGTRWETIKQDKGVTLSSRWLTFGDSIRTRELSTHFVVDADIQSVLINLVYPEKILAWNYGVKTLNMLKNEGMNWITHTVYDIPYPLSKQDLVVQNVMLYENTNIIILLSALPDYIEPIKNITRQRHYYGKWELIPLDSLTTEVKFSALSFSRSIIPRFIRDPIILNKIFDSFVRLKELSSVEANTAAHNSSLPGQHKVFSKQTGPTKPDNHYEKSDKNIQKYFHHTR